MKSILVVSLFAIVLGSLFGCSSNEEKPVQNTPPPSKEQLGTGQQFGFPSKTK